MYVVRMYACMYNHMCTCIYVCTVCTYVCMHACTYVCMYVCMHVYEHTVFIYIILGLGGIAILVLDISYRKIPRYYYLSQFL